MDQLTTIASQRAWSRARRDAGERICFVPTMGALHEGHLTLVRRAREDAKRVIVSIYVNPTQFDNPEDLSAYPVTLAADLALLAKEGVDAVFLPTTAEMYPNGFCTFVEVVGPLTDTMCAVARPGHFRGVATVVTKLFTIVQPDSAVFGRKDLQQVLIISRLTADLGLPVEILVCPTLRDPDGLAMSSRNRRLTGEMRAKALSVPAGLELANRAFKQGERSTAKLEELFYNEVLVHPGVDVDYATIVELPGFKEVEHANEFCVLAVAVFVDGVRLIDNLPLGGPALVVAAD